MKKLAFLLLFSIFTTQAIGAILVFSPNGTYTTKPDLSTAASAADVAGKTVVITSALSSVLSNFSSATMHKWPDDRELTVVNGGSIYNSRSLLQRGKIPLSAAVTASNHLATVVALTDFMTPVEIADANADTMLYDHSNALQAFIDYVVTNQVSGHLNCRSIHITRPMIMGSTYYVPGTGNSYRIYGDGPTGTTISELNTGKGNIRTNPVSILLDFSGQAGPACLFESFSLIGPEGSTTAGGTGIYLNNSNGQVFKDIWPRGLTVGLRKMNTCSYIMLDRCTFEYCGTGIEYDDGVECMIVNSNFYANTCDAYFTGDLHTLVWAGSIHLETKQYGIRLTTSARQGIFRDITCRSDYMTYSPDWISLESGSTRNHFTNMSVQYRGRVLVTMPAEAGCTENTFDGIYVRGPSTAPGTPLMTGIEVGASNTSNTFKNFNFENVSYGIVDASGLNRYDSGFITNCSSVGVLLNFSTEIDMSNVHFSGNAADWSISSGPTVWMRDVVAGASGFTPGRYGSRGSGPVGNTFYAAAKPISGTYTQGDRVVMFPAAVGNPKAWTRLTTGSLHVLGTDWVSEVNL